MNYKQYLRLDHEEKYFFKTKRLLDGTHHGPLTRYVKLHVAHAPGMPGTFPPAADFKGNR